jgi:hypothetical protein
MTRHPSEPASLAASAVPEGRQIRPGPAWPGTPTHLASVAAIAVHHGRQMLSGDR